MIAEDHAALSLILSQWADKKIVGNLDFSGPIPIRQLPQFLSIKNVTAFDANDLALLDWFAGKQAFSVNRTLFDFGFGRDEG